MDNRFDKDPRFREKTIPEVLKNAFQDAGVAVRLVGFNFAEGEEEKAYEQFKGIEALPLPGSFVSIRDADKLAAELDRALRQKVRYWVDREDGGPLPGVPEAGLDVSPNGGNDSWFSLPDAGGSSEFKVAVQTNRRWQQDVAVGPGELLPLQVRAAGDGRHELRRAFVTADDYGDRPEAHTDAWRLAVLQNQRLSDRRLQMLLMLEKSPERPEALLQQLRPRETWVELGPAEGGAAPFDLRWGAQPGYAAPAYGLDVAAWPARAGGDGPARPVVRMWWNPGESEADAYVERDAGRPSLLGLRNVARVADGVTVVVESVQVERRRVEVRPGVFEPRDCLAVRLSHPPGRPFKVEPVGVSPAGQEQRFYEAAGKTTALFWPVGRRGPRRPDAAEPDFGGAPEKRRPTRRPLSGDQNAQGADAPGRPAAAARGTVLRRPVGARKPRLFRPGASVMAEPTDVPTRWREDAPAASPAARRRSRRLAATPPWLSSPSRWSAPWSSSSPGCGRCPTPRP